MYIYDTVYTEKINLHGVATITDLGLRLLQQSELMYIKWQVTGDDTLLTQEQMYTDLLTALEPEPLEINVLGYTRYRGSRVQWLLSGSPDLADVAAQASQCTAVANRSFGREQGQ